MSLEDSMKELADSNRELAAAMKGYTKAITENARLVVTGAAEPAEAATPAKAPPAKSTPAKGKGKGKTETPPDDGLGGDDDGFADGGSNADVPKKITADMVKAKLLEVRDAYGDKAPALKIIQDLGYAAIPDVKPADFEKVWIACDEAIANAE